MTAGGPGRGGAARGNCALMLDRRHAASPALTIRPLREGDLAELWPIFREIAHAGETYAQDASFTRDAFAADWCGRGGEQWVAAIDERIVGGYTLRANHLGRGAHVGTASYVVDRARRGAGVGRELGEHSLERARAMGFAAMQFNFVVSTNVAAVRLWERLGFRVVGRLPGAFRHAGEGPVDALVMFRELGDEERGLDGRVHATVMRAFVDRGHPAAPAEIAATLGVSSERVERALTRLHRDHGLVLHEGRCAVKLAHPFSASPTATWVAQHDRGWWAPCLWCALGVAVLVGGDVVVHARRGGEARPITVEVRGGRVVDPSVRVHFAEPVRRAWDDVVHWCATVQPFAEEDDVAAWCARHDLPRGDVAPIERVYALASAWYGGYLREDWRKWSVDEASAIFQQVGLVGETWAMPAGDGRF